MSSKIFDSDCPERRGIDVRSVPLTGRSPPGASDGGRFTRRGRPESSTHLSREGRGQRAEAGAEQLFDLTVSEVVVCLTDADMIVAMGRRRLDEDTLIQRPAKNALTELAEILGRFPQRWIDQHPKIESNAIRGMHNRIVHVYEKTDLEVVWESPILGRERIRRAIQDDGAGR